MKQLLLSAALLAACGFAMAKIPAPVLDDAAKLKAAETAAKSAWQGKVDTYKLCQVQDKIAAAYRKTAGKQPAPAAATAPAGGNAAAAPAPGVATGTPVSLAPKPIAPCADPGVFAFTPVEQKPLEASGAHSPPGTAVSPPSTTTPAAAIAPAKKS